MLLPFRQILIDELVDIPRIQRGGVSGRDAGGRRPLQDLQRLQEFLVLSLDPIQPRLQFGFFRAGKDRQFSWLRGNGNLGLSQIREGQQRRATERRVPQHFS